MDDNKERIDKVLFELEMVPSRSKAQELIKSGLVQVAGKTITKSNTVINYDDKIEIVGEHCPWVSRAGLKLDGAIKSLNINIDDGAVCLDIGASTGGFTDVLLSHNVRQVFAADVGHSQIADKIRNNDRVVVMEKTDARDLNNSNIPPIDVLVCDVSFVSILKIIENPLDLLKPNGIFILLIKPQFEVGKENIGKGGIVKDENRVKETLQQIRSYFETQNCNVIDIVPSEITGSDGNQEYILYGIKKT